MWHRFRVHRRSMTLSRAMFIDACLLALLGFGPSGCGTNNPVAGGQANGGRTSSDGAAVSCGAPGAIVLDRCRVLRRRV